MKNLKTAIFALLGFAAFSVVIAGCSTTSPKVIAKNCVQATNSDLWACETVD